MSDLPSFAERWLAQRETGARILAALERDQLRTLPAESALAQSEALLAAGEATLAFESTLRQNVSGLIEQQRLFEPTEDDFLELSGGLLVHAAPAD